MMDDVVRALEILKSEGLRLNQALLFLCVVDRPGIELSVLKDRSGMTDSTFWRNLEALKKKYGLIRTEKDIRDTRLRICWLSFKGRKVADKIEGLFHETE